MISAFQNCSRFVNWTYFDKWSTLLYSPYLVFLYRESRRRYTYVDTTYMKGEIIYNSTHGSPLYVSMNYWEEKVKKSNNSTQ